MNQELKKKIVYNLMRVAKNYAATEAQPIEVNAEHSISTREAHAIESIGEDSCTNVTELASYFGFTKSAASQLVSRLTKQGFITKKQAIHSNKELKLSLTPLGWQAFEAHAQRHGRDQQQILVSMDNVELADLVRLNELLDSLNTLMDRRLKE